MAKGEPRDLQSELQRSFLIFGALLVAVFAAFVIGTTIEQEDLTLRRLLAFELEAYERQHTEALRAGEAPPAVESRFIRAHLGTDSLPEELRDEVRGLADGVYEGDVGTLRGEDFFFAIRTLPGRVDKLYLVYDVRTLNQWSEVRQPLLRATVLGAVAVGLLGLMAASRLSRRVLEPVADLERVVSSHTDPAALAAALDGRQDPPELAPLSRTLQRALQRIEGFVQRERDFTRNASHELRTPVTIVRGATELLGENPDEAQAERLRGRIQRSADDMERLIETFLWLAREDPDHDTWNTDLGEVVEEVVASHRPLLKGRPVSLDLTRRRETSVAAPPQVVAVVVANLIKNAFQSTRKGRIEILVGDGSVQILDSGPGPGSTAPRIDDSPHGFGLSIVQDLCRRFGWRAEISPRPEGGTSAAVDFRTND